MKWHAAMGLLAWMLAAASAWAQTSPTDRRRALLDQGVAARDAGDHARALALFTEAGEIAMHPGLRASLAEEHRQLGDARAACHEATRCLTEATADVSRPETQRVLEACTEVVVAACRPFGQVRIAVPMPVPAGLAILVQGHAYDPVRDGDTVVVDPGTVTVHASADGMADDSLELHVAAGETRPVTLTFLPNAPPPRVVAPAAVAARPVVEVPMTGEGEQGSSWRTAGWVGLLGGGALAVTGVLLLGVREGQIATGVTADCHVNNGVVNGPAASDCQGVYDTTQSMQAAGLALLIGGAAVAVTGLVVALVSGSTSRSSEHAPTALLRCGSGPGALGVSCGGVF